MLSNDGYFVIHHDAPLLILASVLCLVACFAAVSLNDHARSSAGRRRAGWTVLTASAAGIGVWATHFFAMMGFITGLASGYDLPLMTLGLLVATVCGGGGFALAGGRRGPALLGGVVVGCGIAAMHACGMAAYEVIGEVDLDRGVIALSVLLAVALSMAAFEVGRGRGRPHRVAATALLAAAICAHHFTALGGVSIGMDADAAVSPGALRPEQLVLPVALASLSILVLAAVAILENLRTRRRVAAEAERMTSLADAAVEGLMICDGTRIVAGNGSLSALSGIAPADIAGLDLSRLLPDEGAWGALLRHPDRMVESHILRADGTPIPVELHGKQIQFAGRPHRAVAVRDLRARNLAESRIHFLAHHDGLTGLPNRSRFEARLDEVMAGARHRDGRFAVLCLDLDRFKEINDLFGHHAGDETLKAVAGALSGIVRDGRVAARLGGDEFAVILHDVDRSDAALAVAAEILAAVAALDGTCGIGPTVGASIGIAMFPADGGDAHQLLSAADTALYRAKAEGGGSARIYEAGMGVEVRDRRRIEHDLRSAVARGEFALVYQPQIATGTGATVGFEALLRWHHPERGSVSPALFVPIAEESGAILSIGEWVLRRACADAAAWGAPLRVAVNVSAVQIHAPGFADLVEGVLHDTGIDPRRLELEITETALIRDIARALAALRRLKALGVKVAMDDFGTGYSSLSNLRAFPFDRIKIDGSFVRSIDTNPQAAAIVRAILELGRGLDVSILAEGVETAAELGFLGAELCHEVQGYLLGRPAPIGHFEAVTRGDEAAAAAA